MSPPETHKERVYGVLAEFSSPAALLRAARGLRDAGFTRFDVFSPFPIHGMDAAVGLRRPAIGTIVFWGGLLGFCAAAAMVFVPTSWLYPLMVSGKPNDVMTAPAVVPVLFEVTILFSAVAAVAGMLALNRLPRLNHPLLGCERFRRASDDGFFAVIEAGDPKFDPAGTPAALEALGGSGVTVVFGEGGQC